MKILKNNIEFFIKNFLKQDVKGILLYGQDVGVLMSTEAEIRKQIPNTFELIKLNLNAENTISELFSESFTPSFFATGKFILISGSATKFTEIESIIANITNTYPNFFLIVINENLDAKSKIRKLFEEHKLLASMPCYADEESDIVPIIKNFLLENKLSLDGETMKFIIEKFKHNREILKTELVKLKTYKGSGHLSFAEAKAVMDEAGEGDIFESINHFFSLNFNLFIKEVEKLEEDGLPASVIISSLISHHFKLLEFLEERKETKKTFDTIFNEKGIFFKQIPKLKDHLSKWDKKRLNRLSNLLLETEIKARIHTENAYQDLTNFSFNVF